MKKFLALLLALVMTMSLVTVGASAKTAFTDDKDITEVEAVEVLSAMGIIDGYTDGSFKPQAVLNRAAGAKFIAYLLLGEKAADGLVARGTLFSDVPADYALAPYVEFCASVGVVDGYGDGKFGPKNALTEDAFAKMLLTALGYESETEGFTGAGWQNRVYALGYKNGVCGEDYTKGASCTREKAAKFALGALNAEFVEYGKSLGGGVSSLINAIEDIVKDVAKSESVTDLVKVVKGLKWNQLVPYTVSGAYETGVTLGDYYGVDYNFAIDVFGRPGHAWAYGKNFHKFYMDAPVLEYTEATDTCDLLVDLGIAKNNTKDDADVLYFAAADKKDMGVVEFAPIPMKISHKNCGDDLGGQGALTQVFDTEYDVLGFVDYEVTRIDTVLAKVTDVKTAKNHKNVQTTLTVYTKAGDATLVVDEDLGFAKKDYVLLNLSFLADVTDDIVGDIKEAYDLDILEAAKLLDIELYDDDVYTGKYDIDATATQRAVEAKVYVNVVGAADSKEAKQTKIHINDGKHTIDGTDYDDAEKFVLGADNKDASTKYTWFFDQYGNVIGCTSIFTAKKYATVKAIDWVDVTKGTDYADADVVYMDGTEETLKVTNVDGREDFALKVFAERQEYDFDMVDHLYIVETDDDGYVTLTHVNQHASPVKVAAKDADMLGAEKPLVNDNTQFLVRTGKGTKASPYVWTVVEGYSKLDKMTGADVEYAFDTDDPDWDAGYAQYVYVMGAVDSTTTYAYYFCTGKAATIDLAVKTDKNDDFVVTAVCTGFVDMKGEAAALTFTRTYTKDNACPTKADAAAKAQEELTGFLPTFVGELFKATLVDGEISLDAMTGTELKNFREVCGGKGKDLCDCAAKIDDVNYTAVAYDLAAATAPVVSGLNVTIKGLQYYVGDADIFVVDADDKDTFKKIKVTDFDDESFVYGTAGVYDVYVITKTGKTDVVAMFLTKDVWEGCTEAHENVHYSVSLTNGAGDWWEQGTVESYNADTKQLTVSFKRLQSGSRDMPHCVKYTVNGAEKTVEFMNPTGGFKKGSEYTVVLANVTARDTVVVTDIAEK